MAREKTAEQVYDDFLTKGDYEEANLDKDEVEKVLKMAIDDYSFAKELREMKSPSWRIVFTSHYDILRELCDQLMRFNKQKISNHQGLFAFIVLKYPKLEFDWLFLEQLRITRNKNKYEGVNISKEKFKASQFQIDLYISAVMKEIEEKLK